MAPNPTMTVKFKAEYRSDKGFRVYATDPTGLYVSSASTYAAAEYFMNLLPCVVASPERAKKHSGLALVSEFDWPEIARMGGGECVFELISSEEMEAEFGPKPSEPSLAEGDFPPQAGEDPEVAEVGLRVDGRVIGSRKFLVVTDFGDTDPVLEEIIARQERAQ